MTDITGAKINITTEETKSAAAVSQATLQRIGASINYINANSSTQLGDVVSSALTVAQFQSLRGNNWVKFDGQDITGSDFAALTGVTTLPLQNLGGALKQAGGNIDLLEVGAGQNIQHRHYFGNSTTAKNYVSSGGNGTIFNDSDVVGGEPDTFHSQNNAGNASTTRNVYHGNEVYEGGSTNEASGIKLNFFIKINNEPS